MLPGRGKAKCGLIHCARNLEPLALYTRHLTAPAIPSWLFKVVCPGVWLNFPLLPFHHAVLLARSCVICLEIITRLHTLSPPPFYHPFIVIQNFKYLEVYVRKIPNTCGSDKSMMSISFFLLAIAFNGPC